MRRLTITHPARSDLIDIRTYTIDRYGRAGADAYDALLKQAIRDVWEDPYRPGSQERPEIGANIRSYHSALSRERAASTVKSPRHFVLYFLPHDDEVAISRVLHDSRDLARHVPDEHLKKAENLAPKKDRSGGRKR